jgi:hypothetical protein
VEKSHENVDLKRYGTSALSSVIVRNLSNSMKQLLGLEDLTIIDPVS